MEVAYINVLNDDLEKIKELALMRVQKENEKNNYELTEACKNSIYDNCAEMFKKENIINVAAYNKITNEIVAACTLIIGDDLPNGVNPQIRRSGLLSNVYTKPEYRNKGFCKQMIAEAIKVAKDKKLDYILLATESDIARHIYISAGFVSDKNGMILKIK